jgi:hypothetical protein
MGGGTQVSDDNEMRFWRAFQREAAQLADYVASGQMRRAFDRVEALLQEQSFDYCFDITKDVAAVLILTPEGNREAAERIDHLLAKRPSIPGWRFYGRRQRKCVDDAFAFVRHIWGCDISDATFDLKPPGEVTLYSRALGGLDPGKIEGIIATFLDHALGESVVMSRVTGVSGSAVGAGQYSADAMVRLVGDDN